MRIAKNAMLQESRLIERAMDTLTARLRPADGGCLVHVNPSNPQHLISVGSTMMTAHRVAWIAKHGLVPSGARIRHTCRNAACCLPEHLELVRSA